MAIVLCHRVWGVFYAALETGAVPSWPAGTRVSDIHALPPIKPPPLPLEDHQESLRMCGSDSCFRKLG